MKMQVLYSNGRTTEFDLPADFDPKRLHEAIDMAAQQGRFLAGEGYPCLINPRHIAEIRIIP